MSGAALRPGATLHSVGRLPSVEELGALIERLARARQELRASCAGAEALEQNRLELGCAQRRLSQALIDRHLPHNPARRAA
jgi:hypothetical protein